MILALNAGVSVEALLDLIERRLQETVCYYRWIM
jgi:hypothetical protein